ncbi:hypothetical protein [Mumia sp. DW29H23]|uniref:hypothetical protein n=1 Tax=Mumia sp. DW29H23 TaxID=3421241 RepID=UPI003D69DEEA
MSEIPVECQPLAEELTELRRSYALAWESMAQARSADERRQAALEVKAAKDAVDVQQRRLDECRGCLDPAVQTLVDPGGTGATIFCSEPRLVSPDFPQFPLFTEDMGLPVVVSFIIAGCAHDRVVARPGWEGAWDPFPRKSAFTVARRFPDYLTIGRGAPPSVGFTTAPYVVVMSTSGSITVRDGRFERSSGHLDLVVELRVIWSPLFEPPRWLWGFYGLDFGPSTYSGLLTTRTVPKTVTPTMPSGPLNGGSPVDSAGAITLVASGMFSGGFAAGQRFELTVVGHLEGDPR